MERGGLTSKHYGIDMSGVKESPTFQGKNDGLNKEIDAITELQQQLLLHTGSRTTNFGLQISDQNGLLKHNKCMYQHRWGQIFSTAADSRTCGNG